MADRGIAVPLDGETRYGTRAIVPAAQVVFMVDAPGGKVSVLAMQDTGGTTRYLWFDTTGDLRTGTTEPTLPNSDGTVVGTQS